MMEDVRGKKEEFYDGRCKMPTQLNMIPIVFLKKGGRLPLLNLIYKRPAGVTPPFDNLVLLICSYIIVSI